MKEIDFLPQVYGERRRQETRVKKQYLALSLMFLVMIVWNASARRSMNLASAALSMAEDQRIRAERVFMASDHLIQQANQFNALNRSLERLKDNLNPAVILSELSIQIPERIVLQRLEMETMKPSQKQVEGQLNPVQIVMSGLGADVEDVGKLIEHLESSIYFTNVSVTHSQTVSDETHLPHASNLGKEWQSNIVEFELICCLATRPVTVLPTNQTEKADVYASK